MLLDVREVCHFADYFVICAGESERQLAAIYDEIERKLKAEGVSPHRHEGTADSGWMLIDYGDVIVHIFSAAQREYYQLEEMWRDGKIVLRLQ